MSNPTSQPTKLWLYLGRRDKKGIQIITIFTGHYQPPTRLTDLKGLNLLPAWQSEIESIIFNNRMLYETWIESQDTFADLITSLKARRYSNLPISGTTLFSPPLIPNIVGTSSLFTPTSKQFNGSEIVNGRPFINTSKIDKEKSMVRRLF